MVSLSIVRATNAQISSLAHPTIAVFVGGTSGIGRAALLELARRKTVSLKVYIVGRNAASHHNLLSQLRSVNPGGEFIFLEAQVTLLSEIKRVTDEIKLRERSIDLLWLSVGALPFDGRKETTEGLSLHIVLAYWGRMLFTVLLLPLLKASPFNPRVLSVLRAGQESADLDLNDLDVKKTAPSKWAYLGRCAAAIETMNSLYLERVAEQNPEVTFIHKFPGLVRTNIFGQGWGTAWSVRKLMFTYVVPAIVSVTGMSDDEVGQRCVYTLFSARGVLPTKGSF
ncbi:NAD(P)-binding protein [Thozetella sp. PMI_491]|nr:NAD(P)-binding protein [Thozetella sp. PMI_491]